MPRQTRTGAEQRAEQHTEPDAEYRAEYRAEQDVRQHAEQGAEKCAGQLRRASLSFRLIAKPSINNSLTLSTWFGLEHTPMPAIQVGKECVLSQTGGGIGRECDNSNITRTSLGEGVSEIEEIEQLEFIVLFLIYSRGEYVVPW